MKSFAPVFAAIILVTAPVAAQSTFDPVTKRPYYLAAPGIPNDGSATLNTSPLDIFPANSSRVRLKLINGSGIGSSPTPATIIWCRFGTVAGAPTAVNGIGSFALPAGGGGIDDQGPGVDQAAVNCMAESGTPILFARQY
jgi:hypothetical protein